MKKISASLFEFIKDYDLKKSEDIICFDATIFFSTATKFIQLPTEVHIVTIGESNMNLVYLLHPDVAKLSIPNMLEEGNTAFNYIPGKALVIKGYSSVHGDYTLSIHPINADCSDQTLFEIHSKTYN